MHNLYTYTNTSSSAPANILNIVPIAYKTSPYRILPLPS